MHLIIVYVVYTYIPRVEIKTDALEVQRNIHSKMDNQQVQMDQIWKKSLPFDIWWQNICHIHYNKKYDNVNTNVMLVYM